MNLEEVKQICSLGTGTMGPGIAISFALAGYQVRMYGRSDASIDRGFQSIKSILETFGENGLINKEEIPQILKRLKGVTTLEEAAEGADFVIESIAEDLACKQEVFAQLEKLCSPNTVFASSTSGIIPTAIAQHLERKERFIVAHFWNPPHLIPLVEIAPGQYTSQNTVDMTSKLLEKIGKKPVVLNREALGFIGNRLQLAMLREALYIVESGIASKEAVDATIRYSIGRRLAITGPIESTDLGGLDVFYNISNYLLEDLCNSPEVADLFTETVKQGNLGAKTGTGFYDWTPESLEKIKKLREETLIQWLNKDRLGVLD